MKSKQLSVLVAAVLCATIFTSPVIFAAATWDFSNQTTTNPDGCQVQTGGFGQQGTNNGTYGNTYKCAATTGTGPTLTVSGWGGADATGSTGFRAAFVSAQGSSGFGLASQFEQIGVSAPNHSIDNDPTTSATPDLILLNFSSAVALDKVILGWSQSDADFTLMAYTGAAAPTTFLQGKNAGSLTTGGAGAGWALVENSGDADAANATGYAGSGTDITRTVNATGIVSSWWLISAYSSAYGGGTLDNLKDYMKVLSVSTKDVSRVAEPGSMALIGLALASLTVVRRRSSKHAV